MVIISKEIFIWMLYAIKYCMVIFSKWGKMPFAPSERYEGLPWVWDLHPLLNWFSSGWFIVYNYDFLYTLWGNILKQIRMSLWISAPFFSWNFAAQYLAVADSDILYLYTSRLNAAVLTEIVVVIDSCYPSVKLNLSIAPV